MTLESMLQYNTINTCYCSRHGVGPNGVGIIRRRFALTEEKGLYGRISQWNRMDALSGYDSPLVGGIIFLRSTRSGGLDARHAGESERPGSCPDG
jgi:hypothetical protein